MNIIYFRTLWGVTSSLEEYLPSLKAQGFGGIEICTLFHSEEEKTLLLTLPKELGLLIIATIQTVGTSVSDHLASFEIQLADLLPYQPFKINVHGGKDCWDLNDAFLFYVGVLEIQARHPGLHFTHETHRTRCFYTPWNTLAILPAFPDLRITADLSHWVLVAERHLLPEFADVMGLTASRTTHIHARPCCPQHIQLAHLDDPFYAEDMAAFRSYWRLILSEQLRLGTELVTVNPEMGPAPYSLVKRNENGEPVKDLEQAIAEIMAIVDELHSSVLLEEETMGQNRD